ncbi:MAG: glycoside hydrolase family 16 protein [Clostridia bacterium]|nr:glycoside hydrolase family 16 protein [Clostridia bacterium]
MNFKKKLSALFLIAVMACGVAACTKPEAPKEPVEDSYTTDRYIPTVEDAKGELLEDQKAPETVATEWAGPEGYTIVVPKGNAELMSVAETLKAWFKAKAEVELKIVTDDKAATDKEIIIGKTKRNSFTAKEGEYFAKVEGGKLIFGGGHNVTVKKAVDIYTRLAYEKGKAHTFSGESDFTAKKLGYTYVWGDEFESTKLNDKLWGRATKMAATAELAIDNTELTTKTENGYLKMTALRHWDYKKAGVEYVAPWSVTTLDTMSYKYGYLEIRARVPFVRGVWPSFWASSSGALGPKRTYDYSIEVDIFEVFSSLDKLSPNIHKWYDDGKHTMWAEDEGNSKEWYQFDSDNLVNEYHTYGFEWTKTKMTMYIDDKAYYTYDLTKNFDKGESGMGGFDTPIYLIFNNHLFTQSSSYKPYDGCEVRAADLPAEYVIDWVRLYQKNDGVSQLYTK